MTTVSQISKEESSLTVFETVLCGRYPYIEGKLFKKYSKKDKDIVKDVLKEFHLDEYENTRVRELSGGLLQRTFLARAIVQNPKLLLLDEPTNHLDIKNQIELMEYCKKYKKSNENIVVAVLHDLKLAMQYSDIIIALKDNQIIYNGSVNGLYDEKLFYKIFEVELNKWKN